MLQRLWFKPPASIFANPDPMGLGGPWWKEEWIQREWPWDAELVKLRFIQNARVPHNYQQRDGTTHYLNRWTVQRQYREASSHLTDVRVRHYFSDKPFAKRDITRRTPQPTEVPWDVPGSEGRIVALHGRVRVPGLMGMRTIPATNFDKRRPYFIPGPPSGMIGALYHREEHFAIPPREGPLARIRF